MVFDPDHMSALARQQALDYLATKGYSGVMSSHTWADDANYYRILTMGGVVTPHAQEQRLPRQVGRAATKADPRFLYGIGWGSDISGFRQQGGPRNPAAGKGVTYPFTGLGGVRVDKQQTGSRPGTSTQTAWTTTGSTRTGSRTSTCRRAPAAAFTGTWQTGPRPTCRCGSAPSAWPVTAAAPTSPT